MRKILLPFAVMGVMAIPLVACDVEDGADGTDGTDTDTHTDTTPDTTPSTTYAAVIVDDSQIFPTHRADGGNPCATSSSGAHGADIDAVGLFNGGSLIGYWEFVDARLGTQCSITFDDSDQAKGTPDGSLTDNFVSLGGGAIIGEFSGAPLLQNGDTIVVYEIGDKYCAGIASCVGDEGYEVFAAEDLDCINAGYPYTSCSKRLSDDAEGEATIPVSGM